MTPSQRAREAAAAMIRQLDGFCTRATLCEEGHGDDFVEVQVFAKFEAETLERAAVVCEGQQQVFLSPQYSTGQPLSSFGERFACGKCAEEIRALIGGPMTLDRERLAHIPVDSSCKSRHKAL